MYPSISSRRDEYILTRYFEEGKNSKNSFINSGIGCNDGREATELGAGVSSCKSQRILCEAVSTVPGTQSALKIMEDTNDDLLLLLLVIPP